MNIKLKTITQPVQNVKAGLLVYGIFQNEAWPAGLKAVDLSTNKLLSKEAKEIAFNGKNGSKLSFAQFDSKSYKRIMLVGLGKKKDFSVDVLMQFGAKALKMSRGFKVKSTVLALASSLLNDKSKKYEELYYMGLGATLADYSFDHHKKTKENNPLLSLSLYSEARGTSNNAAVKFALQRADIVASSVAMARDLVNEPPNILFPESLAARARKIAKAPGLRIKVLDEKQALKENMTLFLSVSGGSTKNPARFIHMTYTPKGKAKGAKKLFLIGKGVTFDSGGLSLKPGAGMMNMKIDMGGSAAVIASMEAVAKLKPNFEVHALVAATENMPDGLATKPGDIVKAKDGTTVEILNTDAEGRLTLADALIYARENGATEMIDLATLTGACMTALGPYTAALYSNRDKLAEGLLQSAQNANEDLWRMPLTPSLKKMIKSPVADLKNIGGPLGGSITAALFLEAFVGDTAWAHLDIAGPANSEEENGYIKKGGVGYGVATLLDYISPL